MEATTLAWNPRLADPTGTRSAKPRMSGKTMVIDKGLGLLAFTDLMETAAPYIDIVKIGFGTSPLYPPELLQRKIELAKASGVSIIPGGTFLEVAVAKNATDDYFALVRRFGYTGIEISDGTIEIKRELRDELIGLGRQANLQIYTEYGKKCRGAKIELEELIETVLLDIGQGAEMVIIEGRESGAGVGIYDDRGECRDDDVQAVLDNIPGRHLLMWEAPQKSQQIHLIRMLGADINLGNIAPADIYALEALRRGLRSDTFVF